MGQIKNIKLHIVTDIKVKKSNPNMTVLQQNDDVVTMESSEVVVGEKMTKKCDDNTDDNTDDADKLLFDSVLETSRFFTSMVDLLPAKFYLRNNNNNNNNNNDDDDDSIFNPKPMKKRKKPKLEDKKFLAKKAKLLKLDPSQHKSITELQAEVEKKEKELQKQAPKMVPSSMKIQAINVSEVASTESLSQLHEKLHAKMDALRGNRKIGGKHENKSSGGGKKKKKRGGGEKKKKKKKKKS